MVQDLDIARWRLRSQHLVWPYAGSAREAVGSLLAVQAENPSQAAWAVASRTQHPDQAELATLLDDGAVPVQVDVPVKPFEWTVKWRNSGVTPGWMSVERWAQK